MKHCWENDCGDLGMREKCYGEGLQRLNMELRREIGALILFQAPMG